jgi:hypothetical protein
VADYGFLNKLQNHTATAEDCMEARSMAKALAPRVTARLPAQNAHLRQPAAASPCRLQEDLT